MSDEPVLFPFKLTINNQVPAPDPLPDHRTLLLLLILCNLSGEILPRELQRSANRLLIDFLEEKLGDRGPSRTLRGLQLAMVLKEHYGMKKDAACRKAARYVERSAKTIERAWDDLLAKGGDG